MSMASVRRGCRAHGMRRAISSECVIPGLAPFCKTTAHGPPVTLLLVPSPSASVAATGADSSTQPQRTPSGRGTWSQESLLDKSNGPGALCSTCGQGNSLARVIAGFEGHTRIQGSSVLEEKTDQREDKSAIQAS